MRWIDGDALIHELNNSHCPGAPYVDAGISIAIGKVCDAPTIESEIVRCKDCKHSRFFDPCLYCYEFGKEIIVPENGFCFMAERRNDE